MTGLDAGTYTVTEKHLDGYADILPFDFKIVPTMSEDGTQIESLVFSMTESDKLIAGITIMARVKLAITSLRQS